MCFREWGGGAGRGIEDERLELVFLGTSSHTEAFFDGYFFFTLFMHVRKDTHTYTHTRARLAPAKRRWSVQGPHHNWREHPVHSLGVHHGVKSVVFSSHLSEINRTPTYKQPPRGQKSF